jgi:hypothetical protein
MYEKTEKTNFFEEVKLHAPLASNKLSLPLHYIQICVFLCIQQFCTWFCHRPIAASVGRVPAGRATPRHGPGRLQPPAPRPRLAAPALQPPVPRPRLAATSHATQQPCHGPSLPLDIVVVPWPRHGPGRVYQGDCSRPPTATSHAMQRPCHGPSLPLNAAAAPWPRHGPDRVCQGRCSSWSGAPSHSHTAATLKTKGKIKK